MGNCQNRTPYVVIVGLASMQGLQAARIMARHKVPVLAVADDPKHYCCRTRVCEKIYFADTRSEEFVTLLEELGPKLERDAVLLPCQDENVRLISKHRENLSRWYRFLLPEPEVVELLGDKNRFYRYAQEQGLPLPKTVTVQNRADLDMAVKTLSFPCIVKPPERCREWSENTTFKAYKVRNCNELKALYERCHSWSKSLIVQEWIAGSDKDLYSCNCYMNAASEPLVSFVARKLRQWPPETGESSLGEECRNQEILDVTLRLFRMVKLRGLGYLELKQDSRSGRYLIVEPNIGRPTGRSAIAEAGGVELLYTMYCDLIGRPLPEQRQQSYTGVKWVHLTRDLASALHYYRSGQMSLKEWWLSWRGRKSYAVFSWSDPWPFLGDLARAARYFLSRQERRRRFCSDPVDQLTLYSKEPPLSSNSGTHASGETL